MKEEKYQIFQTLFTLNAATGSVNTKGKVLFTGISWEKALKVIHQKIDEAFADKTISRHITVFGKADRYYTEEKLKLVIRNPLYSKYKQYKELPAGKVTYY